MLTSLNDISNSDLLSAIKGLKSNENKTIGEIVRHLYEIDCRVLYRDAGYSSLFTYCTEALGYSEGSAYRRIQAARALKDNPEIYELLVTGKLSLCALSEIAKVIKPENKQELLECSIDKTRAEVQKLTAKYQEVSPALQRERLKVKKVLVGSEGSLPLLESKSEIAEETRFTFTVEVDEDFMKLLEEAKSFVGPAPMAEVFKRTLVEFVSKRKKQPRETKVSKEVESAGAPEVAAAQPVNNKHIRYIPRAIRYKVRSRDQNRCTFNGSDGHRCTETRALQLDHILPFALGGRNEPSNLRLLCRAHNRLCAEQVFGREKIDSYFHRGGDQPAKS